MIELDPLYKNTSDTSPSSVEKHEKTVFFLKLSFSMYFVRRVVIRGVPPNYVR
jgi:hypothetical protein